MNYLRPAIIGLLALVALVAGDGPAAQAATDTQLNDPDKDVVVGPAELEATKQMETTVAACGGALVAAWIETDEDQLTSGSRIGFANSADGGSSWKDRGVVPPTPSTGGGDDPGAMTGDPVLVADAGCNFYITFIALDNFSAPDPFDPDTWTLSNWFIGVSKSTDGGKTFSTPTNVIGTVSPEGGPDKPWITIDKSGSAQDGRIYVCWTDLSASGDIFLSFSDNGGSTWTVSSASLGRGLGCNMAVDSQGWLYVAWQDIGGSSLRLRRSDNGGETFVALGPSAVIIDGGVVAIGTSETCLEFTGIPGGPFLGPRTRRTLNGNIRAFEWPFLAVNPLNDHVYVAWNDNRNLDPDILFRRSTDGGGSWGASPPTKVNDDLTSTDQFQPALAVEPTGNIRVVWYDRRRDDTDNLKIDVFTALSENDGVSFLANERITDVSFPVPPLKPEPTFPGSQCFMGDYIGIAYGSGDFHMVWADGRNDFLSPTVGLRKDLDIFYDTAPATAVTFVVDNVADDSDFNTGDGFCDTDDGVGDGPCTLRAAIEQANARLGSDTIDFSVMGTITLALGELTINQSLYINGPGADRLTISGNNASRVFNITGGIVTISDLTIENGFSSSGAGIRNQGTLTLNGSTITMNEAPSCCGGIFNQGTMTLNNSTVSDNSAAAGSGGGLASTGTLTLNDSTVSDNTSVASGAGIFNGSSGELTVTNSTISGNSGGSGGGINNEGEATVTNSTVSGNTAGSGAFGGGIRNVGPTAILTVNSSTVSDNTAPAGNGGGISNGSGGTATLKNTIVANNTGGGDCAGSITSAGHNLDSDGSCGLNPILDDLPSSGNANLGPLQLNAPGTTATHALLPGSDAIDAGLPTTDPDCSGGDDFDQRGVARPRDGDGDSISVCDIGAYELEAPDADGDGLSDSFEADFGGEGINIVNPDTSDTATATGSAAEGSTITSGSISVTFPPGTQVLGMAELEIRFAPGPPPKLEIGNADLAGGTKTVEMPLGGGNAVCIDDRVNATIEGLPFVCGGPAPVFPVCPLGEIEIAVPTAVNAFVSVPTKTPQTECTPTTYVVTRLVDDRVRIDGLVHTAIGVGTVLTVDIDIKPGSDPNSINAASQGLIPVAILSTASFDATTVDGTTVQFGPAGALAAHDQTDAGVVADHQRDVDGDGLTDYVLHFRTGLTGISEGDTEACLSGQTFGGIAIEGCDAVRIVPPGLDSDGDGFGDAVEATITTDQFAACSSDASHSANPTDFNNDGSFTGADLDAIAADIGKAAPPASIRKDIGPDDPDGQITGADLDAVAARIGLACTP